MQHLPFYEVPRAAYLLPDISQRSGNRKQLEEPVRQWCAYELIRAYGAPISEIQFERKVRVGSVDYRIDILVLRNSVPWIVVECKEPKHAKPQQGLQQAISYAECPDIRAEFALYTNGSDWLVKRRIGNGWVAVPDLPRNLTGNSPRCITELLMTVQELQPCLYKLHDPVYGEDARHYFDALQRFFHAFNSLTVEADQDLLIATDNLLRVLSQVDAHPNYRFGKFAVAVQHFEAYSKRTKTGWGAASGPARDPLSYEMQLLGAELLSVIEGARDFADTNTLLLRVDIALLEYGRALELGKSSYPPIPASLHQALREFLNHTLALHWDTALPDPLDRILNGDMKEYCWPAWQELVAGEHTSLRQFVSAWIQWFFHRLCFWKKER